MGDPEVDDLGVLTQAGDDVVLTFTRRFDHPAEKVWRAVTEEEHLATWFPQKIKGSGGLARRCGSNQTAATASRVRSSRSIHRRCSRSCGALIASASR